MRFLATNRSKSSMLEFSANVMRAIAIVREIDSQLRGHLREIEVGCAHHFQNRWPHELQTRDKSRHRIPRQTKHGALVDIPKQEWLARFDRHAPDVDLRSEVAQRILHEVVLTHRNTAADNENVIFASALDRFDQRFAFVATMFYRFYDRPAVLQQRAKQRQIAVIDLPRLNFLARFHQLVTG